MFHGIFSEVFFPSVAVKFLLLLQPFCYSTEFVFVAQFSSAVIFVANL